MYDVVLKSKDEVKFLIVVEDNYDVVGILVIEEVFEVVVDKKGVLLEFSDSFVYNVFFESKFIVLMINWDIYILWKIGLKLYNL